MIARLGSGFNVMELVERAKQNALNQFAQNAVKPAQSNGEPHEINPGAYTTNAEGYVVRVTDTSAQQNTNFGTAAPVRENTTTTTRTPATPAPSPVLPMIIAGVAGLLLVLIIPRRRTE